MVGLGQSGWCEGLLRAFPVTAFISSSESLYTWLDFPVNLTQARVIREEEAPVEEMPL